MFALLSRTRRQGRARQAAKHGAARLRREFCLERLENRFLLAGPDNPAPLEAADEGGFVTDLYVNRATVQSLFSSADSDSGFVATDNSETFTRAFLNLSRGTYNVSVTWPGTAAASELPLFITPVDGNGANQVTVFDTLGDIGVTPYLVTATFNVDSSDNDFSPTGQPGASTTAVFIVDVTVDSGVIAEVPSGESLQSGDGVNVSTDFDGLYDRLSSVSLEHDAIVDGDAIPGGDGVAFGLRWMARADATRDRAGLFEIDTAVPTSPSIDDGKVDNSDSFLIEAAVEQPRSLAVEDLTPSESATTRVAEPPDEHSESNGFIDVAMVLSERPFDRPSTTHAASLLTSFTVGDEADGPVAPAAELNGTRGRSQAFELAMTAPRVAEVLDAERADEGAAFDLSSTQGQVAAAVAVADLVFERIGDDDDSAIAYVYTKRAIPLFAALVTTAGLVLVRPAWGVPDGRDRLAPKFKS